MRARRIEARGAGRSRPLAFWLAVVVSAAVAPLSLAAGDAVPGTPAGGTAYLTLTTEGGEVLVDVPLPADNTWSLEWTHSVAQVQVVDTFAWRDGTIYVTDQYTPYLDIAGLGDFAGRGDLVELPGGGYHLANIDFPLHGNVHHMIIGSRRAPSVLVVGDRRFALSETHPATHARLEVKQR